MSDFLIPSARAVVELQRTHERTFAIELKGNEPFVLYLRLTPTQTLSIINGAPLELVIGSPVLQPNTISIRLNDILDVPFWISRIFSTDEDGIDLLSSLPYMSHQLANATRRQIALFDWNARCIHTEIVSITKPTQPFHTWVESSQTTQAVQIVGEKVLDEGYILRLAP